MKKVLLFLFSVLVGTADAQTRYPQPILPFKQSLSVGLSVPILLGEKENNRSKGFLSIFPSRSFSLAVNLYKVVSVKGVVWRASYLSPDIPQDYDENGLLSSNDTRNKVYNVASGSYLLLAYDYYLPLTHKTANIATGIQFQPAFGIGTTRLQEANFTPHISTQTGFSFFNLEPTHDYQFVETNTTGFAAQFGALGYIAFSRRTLFYLGPTFFTMPGSRKRIYGIDAGLGVSVALGKLNAP